MTERLIIKRQLSTTEQERWNEFFREAEKPPVFCLASLTGWRYLSARSHRAPILEEPYFLTYLTENGETYAQAIISFTHLTLPIGIRRNIVINLYGLTIRAFEKHLMNDFLNNLVAFGKQERAIRLGIIRANLTEEQALYLKELLRDLNFKEDAGQRESEWIYTCAIELLPSEEEILASFRRTTRYEIRKAQKTGIRVQAGNELRQLEIFFDLYSQMWSRKTGHVPHDFSFFEQLREDIMIFNAFTLDGVPIVSAVILEDGLVARYHWGASAPDTQGASQLVQYEAMLWAKQKGLQFYDMGGIPQEPSLKGIKIFKEGFRGEEIKLFKPYILILKPTLDISLRIGRRLVHALR